MGTNFYVDLSGERGQHIGKRSAAGKYCWDCRMTLCKGRVHSGADWYDACPQCDAGPVKETIEASSAGRELGFNKSVPMAKSGVASCSSFSWAVEPPYLEGVSLIRDEYGRQFTREEFLQVLEECPIQFTESIGREFS